MSFDLYIIKAASAAIEIENFSIYGGGLFAGLLSVIGLNYDIETLQAKILLGISALLAACGPGAWVFINYFIVPRYEMDGLGLSHLFIWSFACGAGVVTGIILLRKGTPVIEKVVKALTVKTSLERNKKIDVREIDKFLPSMGGSYDPREYFVDGKYFLGIGEDGKPVYWEDSLPHVQIAGTTGAGKGVFIGMLEAQAVMQHSAVFALDPKNDEWGAHVMYQAAKESGAPYYYIDLRPGACPQFNFFDGANSEEIEELFLAGFGLSERGAAEDFYRIADRKAASECAAIAGQGGYTPAQLYEEMAPVIEKNSPYFAGLLREMGELVSVNARGGIDLQKIVEEGGAVYVVGSMRNAKVIRLQRMFLVRLIQLAERRDRSKGKPRPIVAVLDELKYHISRPALEALGAARDKGLHVVMAHQSLKDLKDCPADLNPDAVTGAVMENGRLKLIYKVEDPDTCEWLARKSGKIQVDDESRQVVKNIALAEKVEGARTIRQSERYYIDEDVIGNLPRGVGVVFGVGLARFVRTSPLRVQKCDDALKTVKAAGDTLMKTADLIDVEAEQTKQPKAGPAPASDLI